MIVDDLIFFAMLGVILGGRIGYVLLLRPQLLGQRPAVSLQDLGRRHVFPWRHARRDRRSLAVCVAPPAQCGRCAGFHQVPLPGLGLFFGRIGNFITNGELWGKVTTVPWGFNVNGVVRHASQLYEALFEGLFLFTVIWIFTSRPRPRLAPSGLFLIVYGVVRFWIEFVRVPDGAHRLPGRTGWLTEEHGIVISQW